MRVVLQRVVEANVQVEGKVVGEIAQGLVVLVGIEVNDTVEDVKWLVPKVINQRIFSDDEGKMNRSLLDINGEVLVISQFTLHAATKKGNRPSFIKAAKPAVSIPLYEQFKKELTIKLGKDIQAGIFGADMKVALINDGPVTIIMDTKNKE